MSRSLIKIFLLLFGCLILTSHVQAQPATQIAGPMDHAIINSLQFSPNGKLLAAGLHGVQGDKLSPVEIRMWEVETGRLLWKRLSEATWLTTLQFSPDCQRILFTGQLVKDSERIGSQAVIWNARNGETLNSLALGKDKSLWTSAFTPDGTQVVGLISPETNPPGNARLKLWDASSGKELRAQETDYTYASSMIFSADGQLLFVLALTHENDTWPLSHGVFYSHPNYQVTNTIPLGRMGAERSVLMPSAETVVIGGIVVHDQEQAPDGRGPTEYEIGLWERTTGKQKLVLIPEEAPIYLDTLVRSPNGQQIIGSSRIRTPRNMGAIHIWDTQSGEVQRRLEIKLKDDKIPLSFFGLALSSDGKQIAVPVASDKIELRNLQDGTLIRAFE